MRTHFSPWLSEVDSMLLGFADITKLNPQAPPRRFSTAAIQALAARPTLLQSARDQVERFSSRDPRILLHDCNVRGACAHLDAT